MVKADLQALQVFLVRVEGPVKLAKRVPQAPPVPRGELAFPEHQGCQVSLEKEVYQACQ